MQAAVSGLSEIQSCFKSVWVCYTNEMHNQLVGHPVTQCNLTGLVSLSVIKSNTVCIARFVGFVK